MIVFLNNIFQVLFFITCMEKLKLRLFGILFLLCPPPRVSCSPS